MRFNANEFNPFGHLRIYSTRVISSAMYMPRINISSRDKFQKYYLPPWPTSSINDGTSSGDGKKRDIIFDGAENKKLALQIDGVGGG